MDMSNRKSEVAFQQGHLLISRIHRGKRRCATLMCLNIWRTHKDGEMGRSMREQRRDEMASSTSARAAPLLIDIFSFACCTFGDDKPQRYYQDSRKKAPSSLFVSKFQTLRSAINLDVPSICRYSRATRTMIYCRISTERFCDDSFEENLQARDTRSV